MKLSESEREVLRELGPPYPGHEWFRPMDVGGTDGSHHSYTLRRLYERDLAERKDRGSLAGIRPVYLYRITPLGISVLRGEGGGE